MATETILSPGILLQEIDKSFITPGVDPSGMAIIGPTAKGPIEVPTVVNNYQDFKNIFGTTIQSGSERYEYYTHLSVKNYFQNGGNSALITRVVKDADTDWAPASSSDIPQLNKVVSSTAKNPFKLETLSKGIIMNSSGNLYTNGALSNGTKDNIKWEIVNPDTTSGTFTLIIRRGDDTTAKPIVLETFAECSLDPLSPNFIARKVGDQYQAKEVDGDEVLVVTKGEFPNRSQYVRVSEVSSSLYQYLDNSGTPQTGYADRLPQTSSGVFEGGTGDNITGNPLFGKDAIADDAIQGLAEADYDDAIKILKNKDDYKFKTLVIPGLTQEYASDKIATVIDNTSVRGDSLFVADLVNYGSNTSTISAKSSEIDSSYATSYWPWVLVRSAELDRDVWCPASVVIPGVYSKNDSLAAPWFAPAGLNRGGISGVRRVEKKLPKATRDTLYSNKINPIATFPGQGIVVFGQKTLQNAKSALDRVNVRRMLLDVKDTIGGFANSILFEQNTQSTRDSFIKLATPYLEGLVSAQGLYAFQVKMDGQLNTPDVIDENKLVGQVFLQPTKAAEFIVIDFVLTRTGASFTD
jgi:hypothetical protein